MSQENSPVIPELAETEQDTALCIHIQNEWQAKRGKFYLVHFHHKNSACEPLSNCEGVITTAFNQKSKHKEKQTVCHGCQKKVKVNIPVLKIQLKLIP